MVALMVGPGVFSSVSLYLTVAMVIPVLLAMAPAQVRRDKRVIVLAAVVLLAAIGVPLSAFYCATCCTGGWLPVECWLF